VVAEDLGVFGETIRVELLDRESDEPVQLLASLDEQRVVRTSWVRACRNT